MDEFDKIREFSEDIANRKEPTLSLDVEVKEEVVTEVATETTTEEPKAE